MPTDRRTCEIRDWPVFAEGYHKGVLYDRAVNRRMGENFARLSRGPNPQVRTKVKLGHDFKERGAESLGFPSFGTISECKVDPDGLVRLSLSGVPAQVGAAINAGLFNAGSIEIAPPMLDPTSKERLYPVLTGVALLGEEQPEVKLPYPIPRAVFADGTEVPAETDVTKWLNVMASVSQTFGAKRPREEVFGRKVQTTSLSFAALTPLPKTSAGALLSQASATLAKAAKSAGLSGSFSVPDPPDPRDTLARAMQAQSGAPPVNDKIKALAAALVGCGIDQAKAESLAQILTAQTMNSDPNKPAAPVTQPAPGSATLSDATSRPANGKRPLLPEAVRGDPPAVVMSAAQMKPGQTESGRRVIAALEYVAPNSHARLTAAMR